MTAVGFVGNGSDKFTELGEWRAQEYIRQRLVDHEATSMVSGHSPVGGIDIWAEEEAKVLGIELDLKVPLHNSWNPPGGYGYRARNLDIARDSDILYVILADTYPEEYTGRRWAECYHCHANDHIKSGGCWTGKHSDYAVWEIIENF